MADPLIKWARNTHTRCHKQRMGCSIWKRYINFFYCALYVNEYSNRSEKREKSKSMKRSIEEEVEGKMIPVTKLKKMFDPDLCEIKIQIVHLPLCRTHRLLLLLFGRSSPIRFEILFSFFPSKKYWRLDVKITLSRRRWMVSQTNHNCLICVLWFAHLPSMEIYHSKPL